MWALGAAVAVIAAPAAAQERTGIRDGFVLKPGSARIVLLRPNIAVGAQSTGGMAEPNADWTDQARENIGRVLAATQGKLGNTIVDHVEPVGDDARRVAEYKALFDSLANSVITYQFFPGNRLPTKKRNGSFVWGMGPGVASLPGLEGADYALFVATEDQYGSTGRKVLQVFAAMGGIGVVVGVHKGFAGLIDLRTGDLVWLNADRQMGGDVRTSEGAEKRVAQLLAGFPGRPAAVGAAPATAK
jgi:hypothetical protein